MLTQTDVMTHVSGIETDPAVPQMPTQPRSCDTWSNSSRATGCVHISRRRAGVNGSTRDTFASALFSVSNRAIRASHSPRHFVARTYPCATAMLIPKRMQTTLSDLRPV
jgi:hypothetical protein